MDQIEGLKYPIGKLVLEVNITPERQKEYVKTIADLPQELKNVWNSLTPAQYSMSYRPGGWTAAQVVHHIADSHMNAYVRTKLALTEDHPTVKPYHEQLWAQLPDSQYCSPEVSLQLISALHQRWVSLLHHIGEKDFSRTFYHPETKRDFTIGQLLCIYDWHSRHHLAHLKIIQSLKS